MSAASHLHRQREAFCGRADTQDLAPLWTRLKTLVSAEPTPVGVAHCWAYDERRPCVLESADFIGAKEAECRVLISQNGRWLRPPAQAPPARRPGSPERG